MKDITLLVMAAGMGSRYGGLKQLDPMGPSGETIIDYSVYDAVQAGFTKAVFIIRKEFESEFREKVTDKYSDSIKVEFVFQDLHDLPNGFECSQGREKPWGTGHAILSASDLIHEPFAAINADDFYGRESYQKLTGYYQSGETGLSMVAYRLENTLSSFGGVTRGVCSIMGNDLSSVIETSNVKRTESGLSSDGEVDLDGSEPVSVNMWGFTPKLFDYLNEMFIDFLKKEGSDLKSEFLIPSVINDLIQSGQESVHVLRSDSQWFGVTYREDKPYVMSEIAKMVENGDYPSQLF